MANKKKVDINDLQLAILNAKDSSTSKARTGSIPKARASTIPRFFKLQRIQYQLFLKSLIFSKCILLFHLEYTFALSICLISL